MPPTLVLPVAAATAAAAAAAVLLTYRRRRRRGDPPQWWSQLVASREALSVREWSDPHWRGQNGWLGTDYIHGEPAAVHIPGYVLRRGELRSSLARCIFPKAPNRTRVCATAAPCAP